MLQTPSIYQDGKIFKDLDFQILIRKIDIRNLETSINKAYKLAGINGPKGSDGMGVDYSRVTSSTPSAHIGLEDAIRMTEKDRKRIKELENEISELKEKRRILTKILKSLDGIGEQIYYRRVIMGDTQEAAADEIGISKRHLQRIEKQMKEASIIFEI